MSSSIRPTSEPMAVVWDFGNVLVRWEPQRAVIGRCTAAEWRDFRARARFDDLNRRADAGLSHEAGAAELEVIDPWLAEVYRHYTSHFADSLAGPIPGVAELVNEVHAHGIPQFGLTNWAAEDFHHARHVPGFHLLQGVVVSGHEGVAKPDPRIFRILLDRYGLRPGGCVFVDDNADNVATAHALGFRALRFEGAGPLRGALEQLGLLPPS
ncbi:MAG: HAD family phosphatase [Actinomycetales bacterium]|nr:HAD family phosphatase [Actinomycetales bacterium]